MLNDFATLLQRFDADRIAKKGALRGCTPTEISTLEAKYSISLPASYRSYLELMGHESQRLFRYDHFAASYQDVMEMTADERNYAADDRDSTLLDAIITEKELLIVNRLSEQFFFIRCIDSFDSPIYYFNNATMQSRLAYDSVLHFLNAIADECVDAIKEGYFGESEDTSS